MNTVSPKGVVIPALMVAPVMLLLLKITLFLFQIMFVSFKGNMTWVTNRTRNPNFSHHYFSGVRVARSSVFCAIFCRPLFAGPLSHLFRNTNLTESGDEHSFSKRGSNSCSDGGTCDVTLVKNAMTSVNWERTVRVFHFVQLHVFTSFYSVFWCPLSF
jgi:hypothetical protein